jgi:hypothetical protein
VWRARCRGCLPSGGAVGGRWCGVHLPLPRCQGRGLAAQADVQGWPLPFAEPTSALAARRPSILPTTAAAHCSRVPHGTIWGMRGAAEGADRGGADASWFGLLGLGPCSSTVRWAFLYQEPHPHSPMGTLKKWYTNILEKTESITAVTCHWTLITSSTILGNTVTFDVGASRFNKPLQQIMQFTHL